MRLIHHCLTVTCAVFLGWGGNDAKAAAGTADVVALVNGVAITGNALKIEMKRGNTPFTGEKKEELLERMVRGELLFSAAKTAGYEHDPEVVASLRQAMIARYLRDHLEPVLADLKVSDKETEEYYRDHHREFSAPTMIRAALIRIPVSPKASMEKKADARRRATKVLAEARALEPGVPAFGNLAITYSEDQASRYRGGDIGWLASGATDDRWPVCVAAAIRELTSPGQISPVISAEDGYYIVKLMETKAAVMKPFAEVKDGVRYHLIREKRARIEGKFMEKLKASIPVTVNREALNAVIPDTPAQPRPPELPKR